MDPMGSTETQKLDWMNNFVHQLQTSPGTYFVTGPDVSTIEQAVSEFIAMRTIANTANTRNKGSIANKNVAMEAAVAVCRQYARLIKWNAGIDAQSKIDAGINPPTTSMTPRPCPLSPPIVSVIAATNGAQTLTYADSLDPDARRKPVGADGLALYLAISDEPISSIEDAKFYRKFTTKPMPVFFESADRGKIATYFGRWIGQRGDMSTPSAPVSMAIAA